MSETSPSANHSEQADRERFISALFSSMVIQQANMALMFLGKVPNPQTGEKMHDLEAARMFIDQLEMLEVKTRGNLSSIEDKLLKESLMNLRLQFVEAAESAPAQPTQAAPPSTGQGQPQTGTTASPAAEVAADTSTPPEEESRKKFSKKY